jgi:hypothetical protein
MQDVALEVEPNILGTYTLRGRIDKDKRKKKTKASYSDAPGIDTKVDEFTKLVKSLSIKMERLNLEGRQYNRNPQGFGNINMFRTLNNTTKILQRDKRNREDQKVQTPLQKNLVDDEEGNNQDEDQEIHFLGDTNTSPHLT